MSNRKRWVQLVAVSILTLSVASVATAGIASADSGDYIYDLNHAGIGGPKDQLLALGSGACTDAHQHVSKADSITHISKSTSLDKNDAAFLYDSAMQFLCP